MFWTANLMRKFGLMRAKGKQNADLKGNLVKHLIKKMTLVNNDGNMVKTLK